MTINQLHKTLGELIAKGHKRAKVCVDKSTFTHPLEQDGAVVLDVQSASVQTFDVMDDDGGWKTRKDGTVCIERILVLSGETEVQP